MRKSLWSALGAAALVAGIGASGLPGNAADHLEAPLVQLDGRTDINDVYVFQSPADPDNTVLIMTVNPVAGVMSPETFDPRATYRFQIDDDGDARADRAIRVQFGNVRSDGSQKVKVRGTAGRGFGDTGEDVWTDDGARVRTGVFDDPFFFDFQAFQDQVKAAGGARTFCDGNEVDFFAGFNVSGIVIEVPTSELTGGGDADIGVWGETRTKDMKGAVDRMGRPAIATALIDDGSEDDFNQTKPHKQLAGFGDQVKNNLLFLSGLDGSGYTDAEAQMVTEILLPDVLTIDTSSTDGYLNGRGLTDDVIDTSLTVVTGGLGANGTPVLTTDCVNGNDVAFPGAFPYLAPAH